jgi:hypothetical protein
MGRDSRNKPLEGFNDRGSGRGNSSSSSAAIGLGLSIVAFDLAGSDLVELDRRGDIAKLVWIGARASGLFVRFERSEVLMSTLVPYQRRVAGLAVSVAYLFPPIDLYPKGDRVDLKLELDLQFDDDDRALGLA